MDLKEMRRERNEQCEERHALAVDRLRGIVSEETVSEKYRAFFQDTALFLLELQQLLLDQRCLGDVCPVRARWLVDDSEEKQPGEHLNLK